MRDSKSSEKKPVQEVQAPRKHDVKLEPVICDKTERKRSEETLVSERNKMLSAFEAMEDGVYIVNQQYDIQYVNPVIEKDFGPWQGCKCYQYFHDRKEVCPWCKNEQVFAGKTVRWEWYSSKNRKTYDLIDTPLKNPDGSISKLEIFRDITERKKMEEQLEQSREFLANTINALDDSFFVKDEEHKWTIFNDAACKAIGRPREELIGKSDYDIFPKEQADVFWEKDNLVFETGETSINEEEITWQGKSHTISTKKSLFKDSITGKRFIVGTVRDITERKQIEKTLRESEQKYRALVEQSLHGIVILQDYRIVFANAAAMEIAGLTIDEARSLSLEDMMAFIPPENRAATLERLKNRFAGKNEPANYELQLLRRNGEEFWLNLFFSPIEYQGKYAIQLAFVDVTDQKRMEEALRRSEIQFREIFENTPVGVYRTTSDGRILMANPALVHMLGFSSFEELSQRNLEEEGFEPQYRRSIFREEIERKGRIVSWESIWTTQDGKNLHVIENARVVRDEDGRILYYEGTAENITERKKAEGALRESEQRYRAIFEQAADSILLIDVETGELVEFNDRAHENLGYTREEFRKLKLSDIEIVESAEQIAKHLEKVIRKRADTFETKHRTKYGEIQDVQISCRAISISGKDFVQSIWHDITERKKAQEAVFKEKIFTENAINAQMDTFFLFEPGTGKAIRWNKAFTDISGYTDAEIARMPAPASYYSHEDLERAAAFIQMVLKEGVGTIELELLCRDGRKVPTEYRVSVINDDQGEPEYIISIGRDITERKRAQEALHKSETRYRELFDNMSSGVAVYEPIDNGGDFVFKDLNRAGERINNVKREDVIGQKVAEVFPGVKEFGLFEIFQRVCEMGRPEHHPVSWYKDDRLSAWFENYVYKLPSGEIVAVHDNITERKQAQEALKESEEKYRAIVERATDSIVTVDLKGIITSCNTALLEQTGYSEQDFVGKHFTKNPTTRIKDIPKYLKIFMSLVAGKVPGPLELVGIYKDGSEHLGEVHISIIRKRGKIIGFQTMTRDITERKQAENKLREYQEQLKSLASELTLA